MAEEASEVTAAATGAAAAVAAVQDDNADRERAEQQQTATFEADAAAQSAAERAEAAADAANDATQAATAAIDEAGTASATAEAAASEAYNARDDVAALRTEVREGWQSFRTDLTSFLDERLGSKKSTDEPTEVVVTHERTQPTAETGTSDAGANPAASGGTERPRRHRFGR